MDELNQLEEGCNQHTYRPLQSMAVPNRENQGLLGVERELICTLGD